MHDVCDVWNFRYVQWQELATDKLWDLIDALKFYVFKTILD